VPSPRLIDELFRDKVRASRNMSDEERFLAGPRLFDYACRIALDGIRCQFPDATEEEARQILRQRLELARRLEQ
jgi:hypothetical protein